MSTCAAPAPWAVARAADRAPVRPLGVAPVTHGHPRSGCRSWIVSERKDPTNSPWEHPMTASSTVNNSVNSEALLQARDALNEAPEAAEFTWKVDLQWKDGTYAQQTIETSPAWAQPAAQAGVHVRRRPPRVFASEDRGATPVEIVLAGLGSCLTAGVAAVAQNRGIQLRSVTARRGQQNILGILGADPDVRNGFSDVTGALRHRRRRERGRHRGARRPVAEAFRGVRHPDQPDERHRPRGLTSAGSDGHATPSVRRCGPAREMVRQMCGQLGGVPVRAADVARAPAAQQAAPST